MILQKDKVPIFKKTKNNNNVSVRNNHNWQNFITYIFMKPQQTQSVPRPFASHDHEPFAKIAICKYFSSNITFCLRLNLLLQNITFCLNTFPFASKHYLLPVPFLLPTLFSLPPHLCPPSKLPYLTKDLATLRKIYVAKPCLVTSTVHNILT